MSETQLPVLEHTIQQTNLWLKALASDLHLDERHEAYSALRAGLHALRDRLTPEQAVHLSAQLPLLVRGIYFEGWRMADTPKADRHLDEFLARVTAGLPPQFPRLPADVARAVFALLWKELDPGESAKIADTLPESLRTLWPYPVR